MRRIAKMAKERDIHIRKNHEIAYPTGKVKAFDSINAAKKVSRQIQREGYEIGPKDNKKKVGGKGLGMGDVKVL